MINLRQNVQCYVIPKKSKHKSYDGWIYFMDGTREATREEILKYFPREKIKQLDEGYEIF